VSPVKRVGAHLKEERRLLLLELAALRDSDPVAFRAAREELRKQVRRASLMAKKTG
jgi:hypothetical protein